MLKVGDGVDAAREWNLPGLFGEPRCGFKGESRCSVLVLRHDGKKDVVALAVRVLHSLVCEELRVVFGKREFDLRSRPRATSPVPGSWVVGTVEDIGIPPFFMGLINPTYGSSPFVA